MKKVLHCLDIVQQTAKEKLKLESVGVAKLTYLISSALASLSKSPPPEFEQFLTGLDKPSKKESKVSDLIKELAKQKRIPRKVLNAFLPHI